MRKDQIISKMKAPTGPLGSGKRRRASLTLPFTALNYHFSQRYIYTFLSRYPVEIFYQAYTLLLNFYQVILYCFSLGLSFFDVATHSVAHGVSHVWGKVFRV